MLKLNEEFYDSYFRHYSNSSPFGVVAEINNSFQNMDHDTVM